MFSSWLRQLMKLVNSFAIQNYYNIVMATNEEYKNGMNAQHKACKLLNEYFCSKGIDYIAEETDEFIDKNEKIDIVVKRNEKVCANVDIKSTTKPNTISYTTIDQMGNKAATSSASLNVDNIQLMFMFDCHNSNELWQVKMSEFYKLLKTLPTRNGTTLLKIEYPNGKTYFEMHKKHNIPNVEFYKYDEKTGTVVQPKNGKIAYAQTCMTDTGAKRTYFDNDSKYVVLTKADLRQISRIIVV